MATDITPDIAQQIDVCMATGQFADESDVLRRALRLLERQTTEATTIQQGMDDVEAGRVRPLDEADAEIRRRHGFPQES
jgi:Arc/MetJ-type ribon-helix-helix transcriptional regulator